MLCNNCGNESHCGEKLKEEVESISTIICFKCKCSECKSYADLEDKKDGEW
jgi:hypothetical protein